MSSGNINVELERSPVGMGINKVSQWIGYADFADGGSTAGTLNMTQKLPVGAFMLGSKVRITEAFTGTVSLAIGNSTDSNKYSDDTTVAIGTAATVGESPQDRLEFIASETTILLTATHSSDWGLVTAGKMLVEVFYLSTVVELTKGHPTKT